MHTVGWEGEGFYREDISCTTPALQRTLNFGGGQRRQGLLLYVECTAVLDNSWWIARKRSAEKTHTHTRTHTGRTETSETKAFSYVWQLHNTSTSPGRKLQIGLVCARFSKVEYKQYETRIRNTREAKNLKSV